MLDDDRPVRQKDPHIVLAPNPDGSWWAEIEDIDRACFVHATGRTKIGALENAQIERAIANLEAAAITFERIFA